MRQREKKKLGRNRRYCAGTSTRQGRRPRGWGCRETAENRGGRDPRKSRPPEGARKHGADTPLPAMTGTARSCTAGIMSASQSMAR